MLARKLKEIDHAHRVGLYGMYRIKLVARVGACTRTVDNPIYFLVYGKRDSDVFFDELEFRVTEKALNIFWLPSGLQIVDDNHDMTFPEVLLHQMRANKASAAGDKNSF